MGVKVSILIAVVVLFFTAYFYYFNYIVIKNWAHKKWGEKWKKKNREKLNTIKELRKVALFFVTLTMVMVSYNVLWLVIPFIGLIAYIEYLYGSIKKELNARLLYSSKKEYDEWHSSTRSPMNRIYE